MRARSAPTRYCPAIRCRVSFFSGLIVKILKFGNSVDSVGLSAGQPAGLGGRERKKPRKRELPNPRILTPAQTAEFPNFRICAHRPTASLG